ncbi:hypothetical protein PO124_03550 [Bacillus licheniformis]|nr:hypothetical protein [Bacillus licheniformis]
MSLRSAALSFLGGITGKKCVMKGGEEGKSGCFLVRNLKSLPVYRQAEEGIHGL